MNEYYTYILECADAKFYVGVTNDLNRRMQEHSSGVNKNSWTFNRRPLKLVYYEKFHDVNQAIAWEKQIKGWRRAKKIALIKGDWNSLPLLAKRKK